MKVTPLLRVFALSIALSTGFATVVWGQPVPAKTPDSVHLFPAGAQRGTTVKVRVGLEQSPPNTRFSFEVMASLATAC